ncbi:alanine racemase [Opitutales bacterium]|uniref:alanine racemase n=1 Tax=Candidatus Seribacter sulfatis TaxID=3381756 RepID=UPI00231FDED9|nr:alanine racemase [Opitutales bacterium]
MITQRCWAEINLAALERNLRLIRDSLPPHVRYVSVVKADAYGHGIHPTAARLMQSGVDLFAVANIKEATEIREMGSGWPILILGPLLEEEDEALIEFDLIPTLSTEVELNRLCALSQKHQKQISVHLKIDSGMGRNGIWWNDAIPLIEEIKKHSEIKLCGALTHFAQPSDLSFTEEQRTRFLSILQNTEIHQKPGFLVHADNSSSLRSFDRNAIFNAVRIGLLQFGVSPPQGSILADLPVEPVLSFHAKLAMIKNLPEGTTLSYGRQYTLQRDSKIGIISAGYGDAIPLPCGNRAFGLINGQNYPLVGRVTMDQTLIDLTDAPSEIELGQTVTLIGRQKEKEILLTELATHAKTIPWELLCSITKRVPRVYTTIRE